jgi:hypothetical protein
MYIDYVLRRNTMPKQNSEEIKTNSPFLKRIYATTTQKDFANFCRRARAEGMDIADAFNCLVTAYAHGADFIDGKKNKITDHSPTKNKNINYAKERVIHEG